MTIFCNHPAHHSCTQQNNGHGSRLATQLIWVKTLPRRAKTRHQWEQKTRIAFRKSPDQPKKKHSLIFLGSHPEDVTNEPILTVEKLFFAKRANIHNHTRSHTHHTSSKIKNQKFRSEYFYSGRHLLRKPVEPSPNHPRFALGEAVSILRCQGTSSLPVCSDAVSRPTWTEDGMLTAVSTKFESLRVRQTDRQTRDKLPEF